MPPRCGTLPEQILGIQGLKARLGEPAAALSRVGPLPCQLIELMDASNDRLAVPVSRKQIARAVSFLPAGDVDGIPPVSPAGGQEQIELFRGWIHSLILSHLIKGL